MTKEPKTPHEEIMDCIESTNDIVSDIQDKLENILLAIKTAIEVTER